MPVDPELQRLLDAPLSPNAHYSVNGLAELQKRIAKPWRPCGIKPAKKPDDNEAMARRANNHARRALEQNRAREHAEQLLAYYATTTVPVGRVCTHTGLSEAAVREGLQRHGRVDPA